MTLRKRFAQNVIARRTRMGLSQENLAKRAGLSRAYVGKIENARFATTVDTIEKLAQALDTDASELFNEH